MTGLQIFSAMCFLFAVLHTFSTKYFEAWSQLHKKSRYSGILHLLGEVEVVFGLWAMIFIIGYFMLMGKEPTLEYIESRVFTEPMFVFVIMVIAGSRPILYFVNALVNNLAKLLPIPHTVGLYFLSLSFLPLLGSFITEPAAMTLAALILAKRYFSYGLSERLKYFTIAVLFVNVSIGGAMTAYAAPPVLMVANKWQWDFTYMLQHFAWRAALAVILNAAWISFFVRKELMALSKKEERLKINRSKETDKIHPSIVMISLLFLSGVVVFSHHIVVFCGLFLFFLGFTEAFRSAFGKKLILREGLLVAFFLDARHHRHPSEN